MNGDITDTVCWQFSRRTFQTSGNPKWKSTDVSATFLVFTKSWWKSISTRAESFLPHRKRVSLVRSLDEFFQSALLWAKLFAVMLCFPTNAERNAGDVVVLQHIFVNIILGAYFIYLLFSKTDHRFYWPNSSRPRSKVWENGPEPLVKWSHGKSQNLPDCMEASQNTWKVRGCEIRCVLHEDVRWTAIDFWPLIVFVGMTKIKMSKEESGSTEFVEQRRASLER